jgi:hypothetical protein
LLEAVGPLEVIEDGQRLEPGGHKQRALLALLRLAGDPHKRPRKSRFVQSGSDASPSMADNAVAAGSSIQPTKGRAGSDE